MKRVKTFQIVFTDPSKSFYCGGEKVCGRIEVEVNEVMRVSAVKVLVRGCAKVEYSKGKQRCRQEAEYLRHEEVLQLDDQPTGTGIYFMSLSSSAVNFVISRNTVACDTFVSVT